MRKRGPIRFDGRIFVKKTINSPKQLIKTPAQADELWISNVFSLPDILDSHNWTISSIQASYCIPIVLIVFFLFFPLQNMMIIVNELKKIQLLINLERFKSYLLVNKSWNKTNEPLFYLAFLIINFLINCHHLF